MEVGPLAVYDAVTTTGTPIARAELVGLLPRAVLEATPSERWEQLDLDEERTIEGSLDRQAHSDPGSSSG
jgi:hypothetical protein